MLVQVFIVPDTRWWFRLRANEYVTVGRSHRANYALPDDSLASVQFALQTSATGCELVHMANSGPPTMVNGVVQTHVLLKDGDVVSAGAVKWRVSIGGENQQEEQELARSHLPYRIETLAHDVVKYTGPADDHSWEILSDSPFGHDTKVLLINLKAAGMEGHELFDPERDLLQLAPASVRQTDSLHVLTQKDLAEADDETGERAERAMWDLFRQTSSRDAAILLVGEDGADDMVNSLKRYVGWFTRPGTLETFVEHGSEELRMALMGVFRAALIPTAGPAWSVYAHARVVPSWKELGLPNPPD